MDKSYTVLILADTFSELLQNLYLIKKHQHWEWGSQPHMYMYVNVYVYIYGYICVCMYICIYICIYGSDIAHPKSTIKLQ